MLNGSRRLFYAKILTNFEKSVFPQKGKLLKFITNKSSGLISKEIELS